MKLKNILYSLLFFGALFFSGQEIAKAQEAKIDYEDEVVIDSDLDGLTDQGEIQLFKTNPSLPDTDSDGLLDGAEILDGTDPLINNLEEVLKETEKNTSWAWYFSRASGFLAYFFLWCSIFLGLAIRNRLLRKFVKPLYSFDFHSFTSISAVFWGLFHGVSFVFHEEPYAMKLKEVFIPWFFERDFIDSQYMALGIVVFYVMIVLLLTSLFKRIIAFRVWRTVHFLNLLVLPLITLHAVFIGTDLQNEITRNIFYFSVLILIPFYFSNLYSMLNKRFQSKTKDEK